MQEALTKFWKKCETKQLANIFKKYMDSLGVRKWDSRRKDNHNSYYASGRDTNWNRATCCYYKDGKSYADENLSIVLRKRSGDYLIVSRQGKRAFEIDYHGVLHYKEDLLRKIIEEHKPLFDELFKITN